MNEDISNTNDPTCLFCHIYVYKSLLGKLYFYCTLSPKSFPSVLQCDNQPHPLPPLEHLEELLTWQLLFPEKEEGGGGGEEEGTFKMEIF